jgi:hypothetical protein
LRISPYKVTFYVEKFDIEKLDKFIDTTYNIGTTTDFIIYDKGYIKLKGIPKNRKPKDIIYPRGKYFYNGVKTLAAWIALFKRYKVSYKEYISSKLNYPIETIFVQSPNIWVFNDDSYDLDNRMFKRVREDKIDFLPKYFWTTYNNIMNELLKYQPKEFYDNIINFSGLNSTAKFFSLEYKSNILYCNLAILKNDHNFNKEYKTVLVLNTKKGEMTFPYYNTVRSKSNMSLVETKKKIRSLKLSLTI